MSPILSTNTPIERLHTEYDSARTLTILLLFQIRVDSI